MLGITSFRMQFRALGHVSNAKSTPGKPVMKSKIAAATAFALFASCSSEVETSVNSNESAAAVALFDGETLAGWSHVLVEDVPKEDVWSVVDGVLVCKGEPLGYLHTDASYQDFTLTFDWRWAPDTEPGNSGVLLRIAGEPETFMPKCVEAQLKHGSAGDIWAFFGASVDGDAERFREIKDHEALGDFMGYSKITDAEKPPGEWNHYEITASGATLELKVNGTLVNQAFGLDMVAGPIGLQSEGGEIHFRNIELLPH